MGRLAIATLVAFVLVAAPASAACDAARPSDRQAWRGELIGRTGVSAKPGGATRRWVSPADAGALLVLAARTDRDGRCWLQVRLPTTAQYRQGLAGREPRAAGADGVADRGRARRAHGDAAACGERVARYRAVVGAPATPTPRGLFALTDAYSNDPGDFLGRWVLTLTAHSDALQRYDGGDGRVALHGRGGESLRDPLGSAASHGCVRISNAAIASIVRRIGVAAIPGTPVRIAA